MENRKTLDEIVAAAVDPELVRLDVIYAGSRPSTQGGSREPRGGNSAASLFARRASRVTALPWGLTPCLTTRRSLPR